MKSYKGKVKRTYTNYVWDTESEMYRVETESKKFEVCGYINDTDIAHHWEFSSHNGGVPLMEMTTDEIEISDVKARIWEANYVPKWKKR